MNEHINVLLPKEWEGRSTEKWSRNVSVILAPAPGFCLMQYRDDQPADCNLQIFAGWFKGYYPQFDAAKVERIDQAIQREMVCELGLGVEAAVFLPFVDSKIYKLEGRDNLVVVTRADITYEIVERLQLREGKKMEVMPFDENILDCGLYGNDRRMITHYFENKVTIDAAAVPIEFGPLDKSLEGKVLVKQNHHFSSRISL
ncbi:hypothetical protein HYX11_04220 [Candidatus Woesearchaeota archaeon]|nr:hypothetical protein [Candidatus Woesearchaeota archaeon]